MGHLKYMLTYPKIGPDMYMHHWMLFFPALRRWLGKRMLKKLGRNSEIRPYATIDGTTHVEIGDNVIIPPGTVLATDPSDSAKIIIEDDVLFGPNCAVYCTSHAFKDPTTPIKYQGFENGTTRIGAGSWLGINVVVVAGVTIGKNCVIGANAVVTKDIPDFSVAVGVPAKVVKTIEQ